MTSAAVRTGEGRELDKPLYTISIAADILATTTRTLLIYKHFGLLVPSRSGVAGAASRHETFWQSAPSSA